MRAERKGKGNSNVESLIASRETSSSLPLVLPWLGLPCLVDLHLPHPIVLLFFLLRTFTKSACRLVDFFLLVSSCLVCVSCTLQLLSAGDPGCPCSRVLPIQRRHSHSLALISTARKSQKLLLLLLLLAATPIESSRGSRTWWTKCTASAI